MTKCKSYCAVKNTFSHDVIRIPSGPNFLLSLYHSNLFHSVRGLWGGSRTCESDCSPLVQTEQGLDVRAWCLNANTKFPVMVTPPCHYMHVLDYSSYSLSVSRKKLLNCQYYSGCLYNIYIIIYIYLYSISNSNNVRQIFMKTEIYTKIKVKGLDN